MQEETKNLHYILGTSLALIAVFVVAALVMINSQATDVSTSTSVDNVAPTIQTIKINDATGQYSSDDYASIDITPLTYATRVVYTSGIVRDLNGAGDITQVSADFYRSGATSGNACTSDTNDCYHVSSCSLSSKNDTEKYYDCTLSLAYLIDSTSTGSGYPTENWVLRIGVYDGAGWVYDSTRTEEILGNLALNIPSSINYGTLENGYSTLNTTNQEMVVIQYGNVEADVNVSSAAAMSCTELTIPVGNQKWALTDVGYIDVTVTALSGSTVDTNLDVLRSTGAAVSNTLYWNIAIPFDVVGSCTGTTVIASIAH